MFICMLLFFHQCEVVGYNRGLLGIVVGTDAGWLVVANVQTVAVVGADGSWWW
jgi:hypothetical protein